MTLSELQEASALVDREEKAADALYEKYRRELPNDVARLLDLAKARTGGSVAARQVLRVIYAGRGEIVLDDLWSLDVDNLAAAMRAIEAAARVDAPKLTQEELARAGL